MDNTPRNDCTGALTANVWETPRKQGCSRSGSAALPTSAGKLLRASGEFLRVAQVLARGVDGACPRRHPSAFLLRRDNKNLKDAATY